MFGIQFTYANTSQILEHLTPFLGMGILGKSIFLLLVFSIIIAIFFVIPFLFATKSYIFSEREKKKRKSMLTQIMTQKEIEDEVEREIREEEIRKQSEIK